MADRHLRRAKRALLSGGRRRAWLPGLRARQETTAFMVCSQQHLLAQPGMTWPGQSRVPRAPPNSSSVHLEDGGCPSLPGWSARCPQTPAVCIRKTGSPPLPEQAREIWGKTVRGLLGLELGRDSHHPEGGWSLPFRAGLLEAGPPLPTFLQQSLQGRQKGPSQDS